MTNPTEHQEQARAIVNTWLMEKGVILSGGTKAAINVKDGLIDRITAALAERPSHSQTYADGFCAQCSELARPLTRALEKEAGVPTGARRWQQTWGVMTVNKLSTLATCLRQLLFALEDGKEEAVEAAIQKAQFQIEFYAAKSRALTAKAQTEEPQQEYIKQGLVAATPADREPERSTDAEV